MKLSKLRKKQIRVFLKQLWDRFLDDDLPGAAAQLSYYLLFSLFPLLVFLVAFVPILANHFPIRESIQEILDNFARVMPNEAMQPIRSQFDELINKRHPKLLSFGLLVALWSASRATDAFRGFLNRTYRVNETRSYIKVQILSILFTIALALATVVGCAAIIFGGKLGSWISVRFGIPHALFTWIRWLVSTVVMMLAVALNYYILPNLKPKLKFVTIGSLVATAFWLFFSWMFSKYAENFGNYNATYGSLGSVIILMTWLYLSGLIFLLGGEINALLEQMSLQKGKTAT